MLHLADLPTGQVTKLAAGGYTLAALTSGRDMYYWGCHPGRRAIPDDVSADPTPAVVEDRDIIDVAVGDLHMLVLTADGLVFGIGDNGNGQLGLGRDVAVVSSWTRIDIPVEPGQAIKGVFAGPRNSFVLISA